MMRGGGLLVLTVLVLTGCGSPLIYRWSGCESSVAALYADADEQSLAKQVAALSRQVETSRRTGQNVPPGMLAHLGYVCYLRGDKKAAARYFQAEKQAFPESARFIDVMLEQIQ